jgi:abhydrolase domain-containing protein 12
MKRADNDKTTFQNTTAGADQPQVQTQFERPVNMLLHLLRLIGITAVVFAGLYAGLLAALTTQFVQTHAIYLHAFQLTGIKDLNVPEMFGFLRGRVTTFNIFSSDGTPLHAWHILPFAVYLKYSSAVTQQPVGLSPDVTDTLGFQSLRNDPRAVLAIHFHGAGGNMGSGHRIPNYRALAAGSPERIHVLTFDYRGFGNTPGVPTEDGLIQDAIAVVGWALNVAKVPPSRILIFGQSLGTAVNMAVAEHFAMQHDPVIFAGHILVAPFVDLPTLATTYKIAGILPILSLVAQHPVLVTYWLHLSWTCPHWQQRTRSRE